MNRAVFMVKRAYNKAIDKVMSATDKIDYALAQIDEQILKYADARTACKEAGLKDKVEQMEQEIRKLDCNRKILEEKRAEYTAKIKCLEAQLRAQKAIAKIAAVPGSYANVLDELDAYMKHIEAELDTMEFINKL